MMTKMIRITMPDDSQWDVPADLVADNRARYYAQEDPDTSFAEEYEYTLDHDDELLDWAANNMDWSEVADKAKRVLPPPTLTEKDFQEGWINGEKQIIEVEDE